MKDSAQTFRALARFLKIERTFSFEVLVFELVVSYGSNLDIYFIAFCLKVYRI